MMQRADGTAAFAAVFGIQEDIDEGLAQQIASEGDSLPNCAGLKWVAAESLADAFERDCVSRLLQLQVMPLTVLVHDMGYYA